MKETGLEQRILDLVGQPGYRPVKPRIIAERLKLPESDVAEVRRIVKRLVRQGQLAYAVSHAGPTGVGSGRTKGPPHVAAPCQCGRAEEATTRSASSSGRPRGSVSSASTAGSPSGEPLKDIYIPAKPTGDAATGDVVLVRLSRRAARRSRPRGARSSRSSSGRRTSSSAPTSSRRGAAYVQVDGTLFAQPDLASAIPGAKNAQRRRQGRLRDGPLSVARATTAKA